MKRNKILTILAMLAGVVGLNGATDTDKWYHEESNFNDGSLEPFKVCTTAGGNYVQVVSQRAKFVWKEAEYSSRGTRMFKGAEICAERALARQQVHTGFKLYVPAASGSITWPDDKDTVIWQNFMLGGCSSWGAVIEMRDNDLWIVHRSYCGTPTEQKIYSNFPRNTWVNFQTHTKVSKNGKGWVHIQANGSRIYLANNINHGFGTSWTNNNKLGTDSKQEQKFGIYAFDDANHDTNEVRTIYFDNCSVYTAGGSTGWTETDPN